MATVRCWNCNTENDPVATAGFCDRCGRKLEAVPETGIADAPAHRLAPEDVRVRPFTDPDADRDYPDPYEEDFRNRGSSYEARKAISQAYGALFAVALVHMVCGGLSIVLAPTLLNIEPTPDVVLWMVGEQAVIVLVFASLGWWARTQPFPPAVLGLILYIALNLVYLILVPEMAVKGFILKICLLLALVKGVQGARTYNQLVPPRDAY